MYKFKRDWIDPVQIFIDKQLGAPWREHQLYKDVKSAKGKSWAWCPVGRHALYINETFSITNTIEDDLIAALDKAHHGILRRVEEEIDLIILGYQMQEVADMLGITRRTVYSDLKSWSETHGEEDEAVLRAIASYLGS